MPFWWNRRRRWWTNYRFRKPTRRYRYKHRRPRKNIFRRYNRRAHRRRRRRHRRKVRRKKPFLKLLQWQPQYIRKCKIKGFETLILGADGKQFRSYTTAMFDWTPPKVPTGGGFAVSNFSLGYLYEQYNFKNNIWTTSNEGKDLCRYTGCTLTFYRHETVDFLVTYSRSYPMNIDQFTYAKTHPHNMLLQKHIIIIPSRATNPNGKLKIKKRIKPPRQMTNKWFFADKFESTPLLQLRATATDLTYITMGKYSENQLTNFLYINEKFYVQSNWGESFAQHLFYMPVSTWSKTVTGEYLDKGQTKSFTYTVTASTAVSLQDGWFDPRLLKANKLTSPINTTTTNLLPIGLARYNPSIDTGKNNKIWLISTLSASYQPPQHDKVLVFQGLPLWMLLFGWTDYVLKIKNDKTFLDSYTLVIQSPAIKSSKTDTAPLYLPIDDSFVNGLAQYDTLPVPQQKNKWFPTINHQLKSINNIVKCGPNIARMEGKQSNWELHVKYSFFFKWGGADTPETNITNPADLPVYPVPDTINQKVQIRNPATQIPQSMFHTWDYRRGSLTATAIKRMSEHLPDESISSTDADPHSPHKKLKLSKKDPQCQEKETELQQCLQQLFEENTFQEIQASPENTLQLIQQQQQQQQQIKHNLLKLLIHLKTRQRQMQLQAGILE
nr:MAG: ORF1 [Torque teno midi virus]